MTLTTARYLLYLNSERKKIREMSHNKYNQSHVIEVLKTENFKLLNDEIYINAQTPMSIRDKYGYLYKISFTNFKERIIRNPSILQKFGEKNPYTIENIKMWLKENHTNLELLSDKYPVGRRKVMDFKCQECQRTFSRRWDTIESIKHCVFCYLKDAPESRSFIKNFPNIAKEWDYEKNEGIDINTVYSFSNKKYWWKCQICGNSFYRLLCHKTRQNVGCPICSMSGPVKYIYNILQDKNILFDVEYWFDDLVSDFNVPLRYDFVIFKKLKEVLALVEYDDIQHEEFIPYFHETEAGFNYAMRKDEIKNLYAKNNKIPLLRITYRNKDNNNIEDTLLTFIQQCGAEINSQ